MIKYFSGINAILVIACGALVAMLVNTWINPPYTISSDPSAGAPLELKKIHFEPTRYTEVTMRDIIDKNLFRKQRESYPEPADRSKAVRPQSVAKKPVLIPPPKFILNGVMLTATTRIAFLEEKSSETGQHSKSKGVTIKRKGYRLGERVGNYRITEIQKKSVKLTGTNGDTMTIKIKKHDYSKRARIERARSAKQGIANGSRVKPVASLNTKRLLGGANIKKR